MGQEKNRRGRLPETVHFVAEPDALQKAAEHLASRREVAVDVEADSMFHFREKVCLLQMASTEAVFIVDPLQLPSIEPLASVFEDERVRKVFHGADYDVRSLHRDFHIAIRNLFDTELAARFLGLRESGLEALLSARFDVKLDKRYQRKDWSRRPLPEEMVSYAAQDVRYLIALARQFDRELKARGRRRWVEEECLHLSRVRPADNNGLPLFLGVKGAGRLAPRRLAVLEELLHFRREVAREKDRPLFKVLGTRTLLKIAGETPQTPEDLEATGALSRKQFHMYGQAVLEAVHRAMALSEKDLPRYPRKSAPRLSASAPRRVQALKAWRDRKADDLGMDPGLLINKTLIQAVAVANPSHPDELRQIPEFRDWRRKAFGSAIVDALKARP